MFGLTFFPLIFSFKGEAGPNIAFLKANIEKRSFLFQCKTTCKRTFLQVTSKYSFNCHATFLLFFHHITLLYVISMTFIFLLLFIVYVTEFAATVKNHEPIRKYQIRVLLRIGTQKFA
jgi:hypothetical protein